MTPRLATTTIDHLAGEERGILSHLTWDERLVGLLLQRMENYGIHTWRWTMGAMVGMGATHWPTLFLEPVRQVAQRADAWGFRELWVTGDTNV